MQMLYEDQMLLNALNKFKDSTTQDIKATETQVSDQYQELLKTQMESYSSTATFVSEYSIDADGVICYYPKGYCLMQNLLLPKSMDKKEAEAILAAAKGTDEAGFIKLLLEKGTDPGMSTEARAKKGYLIGNGDGMDVTFSSAAKALKSDGDVSGLVTTQFGYHIIRKIKNLPSGIVPLENVKQDIEKALTTQLKDEKWSSISADWLKEATVTKFMENVKDA